MTVDPIEKTAKVYLDYLTSAISDGQATNVASTFGKAWSGILTDPHVPCDQLNLLSDRNRDDIFLWNRRYPAMVDACLHHLVERRAASQAYAQAVCAWDASFTYQGLDQLSTRLAHHLVRLGVGPEVLVPFCFPKSAWTVVAMLAVMKAGGATVAIDPTYPISRVQGIIRDTNAKGAVAAPATASLLKDLVSHVVVVDRASLRKLPAPAGTPCTTVRGTNPAFVVFTSGSTGKPKAIVVEHRAICTSSTANARFMQIDSKSRVLQFAAYTFDVSIQDIFTTLIDGGCVHSVR